MDDWVNEIDDKNDRSIPIKASYYVQLIDF